MLKGVIMDFDGVIVDTEAVWYDIFAQWFKKNKNYDLSVQQFLLCVGSNSEDLFHSLEKEQGMIINRRKFTEDTQSLFIQRSNTLPPKKGVAEFIESVKSKGLKLALATSSTRLKPTLHLTRLGFIDQFDEIVTAEDVKRIKPYPDLFLKAAEKLKAAREEVLVVEDSLNGFAAGKNAGMRVLIVPNEVTQYSDFTECYKKVNSLADVNAEELIADFKIQ